MQNIIVSIVDISLSTAYFIWKKRKLRSRAPCVETVKTAQISSGAREMIDRHLAIMSVHFVYAL